MLLLEGTCRKNQAASSWFASWKNMLALHPFTMTSVHIYIFLKWLLSQTPDRQRSALLRSKTDVPGTFGCISYGGRPSKPNNTPSCDRNDMFWESSMIFYKTITTIFLFFCLLGKGLLFLQGLGLLGLC